MNSYKLEVAPAMHYEIEDVNISRKRIRFEIPAEEVQRKLDTAFESLRRRVQLKGFRRGRVPRRIVQGRFGKQVREDVAGELVQRAWEEVRPQLKPVGRPQVEGAELKAGAPLEFTITVDVLPELVVENYKELPVHFPEPQVTDEEVEEAVRKRLEHKARIVEVTDGRPAGEGDIAICRLVLKDGDEVVAEEAGTAIRIGDEKYYPGVDELVKGLSVGESRSGRVKLGESELEQLSGRELDAEVEVLSIQTSAVPELTDELAAELGYEGGAEAMRQAIRDAIRAEREEQAKQQARNELANVLVERNPFELPQALVDERFQLLVEEARALHIYRGNKPETFHLDPELEAYYRRNADFNVRLSLLLAAVARQEGLEVTEQDLEAAYQKMADERGQTVEAIKGYFIQDDAVDLLRERLLEQKVLDWLLEHAERLPEEPAEDGQPGEDPEAATDEAQAEPDEQAEPAEQAEE